MTPNAGDSHPLGHESLLSDASVRQLPPAMLPAEGDLPVDFRSS
jgi:hypothetical protein